ncbi:MAG: dihydroneopterin aldolase [Actinobacteria bacterium]|nr:dihydroneopterin aldolase [Actinomycetota bacterium]
MDAPLPAKIVIFGLEVFAYHGCTPEEKERGQRFLLDLEVEYDAREAVEADDLSRAVDYDRLAAEVHDLAARERYDLIETLAAEIGAHVMRTTPARRALVRVRKPEAPLSREMDWVGVEMGFTGDGGNA